MKQSLVAISSNHSEIIALYEAGRECVWLRSIITHIHNSCCLTHVTNSPTIIYEDNVGCVAQVRGGYIKGDRTKHNSSKIFYTHEVQESRQIDVKQIQSINNLADLFIKSLPTSTFDKLVYDIGMRRVHKMQD